MTQAPDVMQAILSYLEPSLRILGIPPGSLDDETDLRKAGLVDSLGFLQLLSAIERQTGRTVDVSTLEPERLTHVGSLVRHIARGIPGK